VAQEPDAYNCDTCPVRAKQDALDDDNRQAVAIWAKVGKRLVLEHGLAGWLLTPLTRGWTDDAKADLVERLAVIYDALLPPPKGD
jgi:hypothetical protein